MILADGEMTLNPWTYFAFGCTAGLVLAIVIVKLMKPRAAAPAELPWPGHKTGNAGATPELCVDGHDVPAPQARRELAVLRRRRHAARL